ncbi:MAG: Tagatose-bisphosphate aldolase [Candidatus Daviesbacteria bacterium GW2011_GWA1_36_8]|nr:MAG: Tagatose-bisphosphate aldolase [Candidatus Daviesbacteria bacterium GW2011_GWB1_36_5]KKQ15884.1 MAG: Tagatose-bisphosphate aldolase [Candidatus Daviesbacteria bacterium GW2011_GWA1_36_8]
MLAFDHRGSFKKMMNPSDPEVVSDAEAIELKKKIIDSLREKFSAVLIDQDIGFKAYEPKDKPFLLPVEKSGYEKQGKERITDLEYSLDSLINNGASGAKILIWFNPYAESAQIQIETCKKLIEECKQKDFPFFLEIRTYDGENEADKMSEPEREKINIDSLKMFLRHKVYPDVYKLEYPGSAIACQTFTAALALEEKQIPWIMLTMGASFDEFCKELEIASVRGCQGFLAGRALWQEACSLKDEELEKFLSETLPERFQKISEIVSK